MSDDPVVTVWEGPDRSGPTWTMGLGTNQEYELECGSIEIPPGMACVVSRDNDTSTPTLYAGYYSDMTFWPTGSERANRIYSVTECPYLDILEAWWNTKYETPGKVWVTSDWTYPHWEDGTVEKDYWMWQGYTPGHHEVKFGGAVYVVVPAGCQATVHSAGGKSVTYGATGYGAVDAQPVESIDFKVLQEAA